MKKLTDLLKFTSYEKKVIVFLLFTSFTALAMNVWSKKSDTEYKNYEYSKFDSIFYSSETIIPEENNEKNVDSKHELLDLRVSDNNIKNSKSKLLAEKSININTADISTLVNLPGIGHKTAGAIVAFRVKNGLFTKIEDLMKVKGIGKKKFEKLKKYINLK